MFSNAIKALQHNRLKTSLIYFSLSFSIIAIFLITAISNGVISMYATMLQNDGDIIVTQAKISDTFFSNVDISLTPQIENIDGVQKVSAMIVGASPVETLPIVAIYGSSKNRLNNYKLISGRYPKSKEVIVGKYIYDQLQNKQSVKIADDRFTISGVYESNLGFENGGLVMNMNDAGEIFNKSASFFLVNIDLSQNMDTIAQKINALSNKLDAKSTNSFVNNYNQFKIINNSSYAVSFIAFSMGLLGIASIMSITINERKDEFGIMKAIGINSQKIISSLLIESFIIGVISYLSAFFLANVALYLIKNTTKFQGYISGEINTTLASGVFLTTIIMTLLGAFIPSYMASKVDPITLIQRAR